MIDNKILTKKLEQLRIDESIAGMSVAITNHEKTIYNQGFGYESAMRPEIPTCPDALYKIASITIRGSNTINSILKRVAIIFNHFAVDIQAHMVCHLLKSF